MTRLYQCKSYCTLSLLNCLFKDHFYDSNLSVMGLQFCGGSYLSVIKSYTGVHVKEPIYAYNCIRNPLYQKYQLVSGTLLSINSVLKELKTVMIKLFLSLDKDRHFIHRCWWKISSLEKEIRIYNYFFNFWNEEFQRFWMNKFHFIFQRIYGRFLFDWKMWTVHHEVCLLTRMMNNAQSDGAFYLPVHLALCSQIWLMSDVGFIGPGCC